jgi:hypothetical protein
MTPKLSDTERSALKAAISTPAFAIAAEEAVREIWARHSAAQSVETSAMAHHAVSGAIAVLDEIFSYAEVRQSIALKPRKLIHNFSRRPEAKE